MAVGLRIEDLKIVGVARVGKMNIENIRNSRIDAAAGILQMRWPAIMISVKVEKADPRAFG